ncbi:transposase, partial [Mycobacterium tuberculosis BTB13-127]
AAYYAQRQRPAAG